MAGPLGADVHWGVTDTDLDRCAEVVWELPVAPPAAAPAVLDGLPEERRMVLLGYTNPPGYSSMGVMNTPQWRRAQVPSTNLHASARGIARSYQGLLAGDLLDADVLAEATSVQSEGWCPVLERGRGLRPRVPAHPSRAPARSQSAVLRALRHRWCCLLYTSPSPRD